VKVADVALTYTMWMEDPVYKQSVFSDCRLGFVNVVFFFKQCRGI